MNLFHSPCPIYLLGTRNKNDPGHPCSPDCVGVKIFLFACGAFIKVFVVVVVLPKGQQVGMYQDRTVHMRESTLTRIVWCEDVWRVLCPLTMFLSDAFRLNSEMDTYLDSKAVLLVDGGRWTESFTTTVNYDNLWQIIFAVQSPGCRIIIIYYVVYSSVHSLPPSHIHDCTPAHQLQSHLGHVVSSLLNCCSDTGVACAVVIFLFLVSVLSSILTHQEVSAVQGRCVDKK